MCVSIDTELRGLAPHINRVTPHPNPVLVTSADRSVIELPSRNSSVRFVNPDNDDISDIKLSQRDNDVRFVNPDNDDISDIEFPPRDNDVRLIACSSPVKSLM